MRTDRARIFKKKYGADQKYTARRFVEICCDGSDYERGQLEKIEAQCENVVRSFGILVEILHAKKVISTDDVYEIVGEIRE